MLTHQNRARAELVSHIERHAALDNDRGRELRTLDLVEQVVLRVLAVDSIQRRRLHVGLLHRNAKELRRNLDDAAGLDVERRFLERHEVSRVLRLGLRILDLVALEVIKRRAGLRVR